MIRLNKISPSDKVSNWIACVNNIVDVLKLAVSPSVQEDGSLHGGNDGFMSKEDKKILDDIPDTYKKLNGEHGPSATWGKLHFVDSGNEYNISIESNNFSCVKSDENFNLNVSAGLDDEYSDKYVLINPKNAKTSVSITVLNSQNVHDVKVIETNGPLLVHVIFVSRCVYIETLTD